MCVCVCVCFVYDGERGGRKIPTKESNYLIWISLAQISFRRFHYDKVIIMKTIRTRGVVILS